MIVDRSRKTPRRRGFGLVEMAVAGVLLATIIAITAETVARVTTDRKATARREAATRLVGNVMERALARPWSEISTEALTLVATSANVGNRQDASLRVEVTAAPEVGGRGVKRVVVEVRWPDRSKVAESPVRLVAWCFEPKGVEP